MRAWLPGFVCVAALAQSPSNPYPLEHLTVQGNKHFTAEQIIAASGLKIGQTVNREAFDAARARLLDTGAFESVGYDFKPSAAKTGYDATFDVAEIALLYRFRFEDLPAPDDALRAAVTKQSALFREMIPATREVLDRFAKTLTQALGGKVTVEGRLNYDLPGEPTILFRPAGDRPRIAQVHFTGNQVVPSTELFNKFASVAVGAEYSDATIRRLLDLNVRPMYEAHGRLRVAFPRITAEPSRESGVLGVALAIEVDEGPEYKLGQVRYGGVAARQSTELDDAAKWRKDEVANFDEIKAATDRIARRYKNAGYVHATARAERSVHDAEHTVDLTVTADTGPQFRYGKLQITGLDIYSEPAIRKMWGEREGKPYDAEAPEAFLKSVRDQGIFDNLGGASSEAKINEDSRTVDVTLVFQGTKNPDAGRRRPRPQ